MVPSFLDMSHWARLFFMARRHLAATPGLRPIDFVTLVHTCGNFLDYTIACGFDIQTVAGGQAADFYCALYTVCRERCDMGLGHLPYNPAPFNGVVAGAEVPAGGHVPPGPPPDQAGGFAPPPPPPDHGPNNYPAGPGAQNEEDDEVIILPPPPPPNAEGPVDEDDIAVLN
jgi:hypothetical protein